MKSGNLNFLESSGLLQACNGTDLPFTFSYVGCLPADANELLLAFTIRIYHNAWSDECQKMEMMVIVVIVIIIIIIIIVVVVVVIIIIIIC
jgi:hypothetical protein